MPQEPRIENGRVVLPEDRLKNRIAIILDKSGSMVSIRDQAISLFNEQVQTLKANRGRMDTKVSLVTFADKDEVLIWNQQLADVNTLTAQSYLPAGSTALFDTVGRTISKLAELPEAAETETSFLIVVITDGEENASKEWSSEKLAGKIKALQDTNRWTFAYMGANVDLSKVREGLGLHANNMAMYASTSADTMRAAGVTSRGMANYMVGRSHGMMASMDFYQPDADLDEIPMVITDSKTVSPKDEQTKTWGGSHSEVK